jgi:DNA-binding protein YbaB
MFKAIGGLGNISAILNNLQHIGPTIKQVTDEMRGERITASAGNGAVEVTLNGIGEMQHVQILDESRQHEKLQAWIVEATNIAGASAKRQYADAISRAADDLNLKIPGLDAILGSLTGGA